MSAVANASRRLTLTEAVLAAIVGEMDRDPKVIYIGQDVGAFGGAMQGTQGLYERFGPRRVLEAPISESAMVGAGVGAALFGLRAIVEISFGEFLPAAMNQLVNQAPNLRYMTGGEARVPVVIRTRVGDGPYGGHPQDYSAWFAHIPGLKVVMPGHPADAKGLMLAALRDGNPVLYVEPMSLAHGPRAEVPDDDEATVLGTARYIRRGRDVTVVAIGSMVPAALTAADAVSASGIDAEVIDLRTLRPWDRAAVANSVVKTGRLVFAQEAWATVGFGAEVIAAAAEDCGASLRAARRVGTLEVPVPSGPLRKFVLPGAERIAAAINEVVAV